VVRENINHWKRIKIDLSAILFKPVPADGDSLFNTENQDHEMEEILDWKLLDAAKPALDSLTKIKASFPIKNTNRTVGTLLSNEISIRYKNEGLPEDTLHFTFTGTAGQSFGAFGAKGLTLELEGDANDYFGKGLSGAQLIIYPAKNATYVAEENSIIGNVAFYGATSGSAYIRGKAGERFAVRNSGANVVVESIGDHGCEYMTGGCVVVLGNTGRNFGAGMSGGIAYVYDVRGDFHSSCNTEMVDLDPLSDDDARQLFGMISKHSELTLSTVAKFILSDFDQQIRHFVKVFPKEYKKVLQKNGVLLSQKK